MKIIHGYGVFPETGVVLGRRGKPIKKRIRSGYLQAQFGAKHWMCHRLVWESVHGPIPEGMQVNHINGIKDDNRIANLEIVTPSENLRHAYRLGLARADGVNNGRHIGKIRSSA